MKPKSIKYASKQLKGNETELLCEKVDFKYVFSQNDLSIETIEKFTKLLRDFIKIIRNVKEKSYSNINLLEKETEEWLNLFKDAFHFDQITPYMHIFFCHMPSILYNVKDIDIYNIQGLEKLNDLTTQQYFRASNRQKNCFQQIIKLRNRMDHNPQINNKKAIKKSLLLKKNLRKAIESEEKNKEWCEYKVNELVFTKNVIFSLKNNQRIDEKVKKNLNFKK